MLATAAAIGSGRQSGSSTETVTIDENGAWRPFPHFWEEMFGSGRAVLSLREAYRRDLQTVKQATGFTYVRFHAILDDENGVYDEDAQGHPIYNFSYVDQIYDGLLENGVKPFVELSFMPKKLAANLQPHPFWYKPLPSPPKDSKKWAELVEAFVHHLEDRYGNAEVRSWYFEVWNEPNIDFWDGVPKQSTYFDFYDVTAKAVKGVDQQLRVGGPATAQAAWVDAFIAHCVKGGIPFDFVSSHIYGNENPVDVFGKPMPIPRRDMVGASVKKVYDQVKSSAAPNTPIIWSEYNATYMTQQQVTDSAFMGPWLANNIRECDGMTLYMSYWSFSDVFEEQGIVKTPFYGGYGLIAERSIPKPAYNAFVMLHQLGSERLQIANEDALVTRGRDGLAIALWNYAEPGESMPDKQFVIGLAGSKYKHARVQLVDPARGSSLAAWKQLGSPQLPTLEQIKQLRAAAQLPAPTVQDLDQPIRIPAQGLALVTLSE